MAFLQRQINRGSVSTGYEVANSLKTEPDNGERFVTGDIFTNYSSVRKFTVSTWLKRTEITVQSLIWFNSNTNTSVQLEFNAADKLSFLLQDNVGNGVESYALTQGVFRDTSAYYHVILAVDTTQGTAANRTKIYINGVNQTLVQGNGSYDTFPAQNYDVPLQTRHYLLGYDGSNNGFRGYVAEYYFLDGIAASPTDLGEFDEDSGIWKPIEYTGNYGTEGYYMNFSDSANMGKDHGPNAQGNGFADPYGIAAADQSTDTPTNNFATTNPLYKYGSETFTTEGATVVTKNANGWVSPQSTICPASGKWYMEFKFNAVDSRVVGAAPIGGTLWNSAQHYGGTVGSNSVGYADTGYLYVNDSGISSNYGPSYDNSNIIAVALDMDNGYIYWAKDNTWINSANPVSGSGGYALPAGLVEHSIGASIYQQAKQSFANFGGYTTISISSAQTDANGYGTFEYAPPSGYYALCGKNLAEFG